MTRGALWTAAALVAAAWLATMLRSAPAAPPPPSPAPAVAPAMVPSAPVPAAAAFDALATAGADRLRPAGDPEPEAAPPTVGGWLLDELGRPLSGPRVELRALAGDEPVVLPGRIDAAGRFCVPVPTAAAGLHAVACNLVLCADRLELATLGIGVLRLPAAGPLDLGPYRARRSDVLAAGRVLLGGAAATGCDVAVHRSAADAAAGIAMHRVRADHDGWFELRGATTGAELWLTARAAGAVAMLPRAVPRGSTALELRLQRGRLLSGTVRLPAAPSGVGSRSWPRLRVVSADAGGEWPIDLEAVPPQPDGVFALRLLPVPVPAGAAELQVHLPGLTAPWTTQWLDPAADVIEPCLDLVANLRWIPIRVDGADRERLWAEHAPLRVGDGAHPLDLGGLAAPAGCWWPRDRAGPAVLDRHGMPLPCTADADGGLRVLPAQAAPRWLAVRLHAAATAPPGAVLRLQLGTATHVLAEATAHADRDVWFRRPDDPELHLRLLLAARGNEAPTEVLHIPLLGAGDWVLLQPDPARLHAAGSPGRPR